MTIFSRGQIILACDQPDPPAGADPGRHLNGDGGYSQRQGTRISRAFGKCTQGMKKQK